MADGGGDFVGDGGGQESDEMLDNSDENESENELYDSDNDLEDGFLNLPMNDALRGIIEGDDHDEDDEFYGFAAPLPAVPDPDWRDTENLIVPVSPYSLASGPTMDHPPGDDPLSYFQLYFEDPFLMRIVEWTNLHAERKIRDDPEHKR